MNTRAQFALVSALAFISTNSLSSVTHPVASFLTTGWEATGLSEPLTVLPDNPPQACTLRIHVDGFRNTHGNLGTIIFRSPDGWPEDKDKSFRHGPAPIDRAASTAVAVWSDLPAGDYGVAAIHDENSNAKLDRNLIGVPKEGFGFANNPHVGLVPPSFEKAKVHVSCPATDITVHLQYK